MIGKMEMTRQMTSVIMTTIIKKARKEGIIARKKLISSKVKKTTKMDGTT